MSKWEITGGDVPDMSWKVQKYWWIMTWIVNGSKKQSDFAPKLVFWMDGGVLMMHHAPEHALKFGDNKKEAGPAGDRMFYIDPKNVWARMPAEIPQIPNVDMYFKDWPF